MIRREEFLLDNQQEAYARMLRKPSRMVVLRISGRFGSEIDLFTKVGGIGRRRRLNCDTDEFFFLKY